MPGRKPSALALRMDGESPPDALAYCIEASLTYHRENERQGILSEVRPGVPSAFFSPLQQVVLLGSPQSVCWLTALVAAAYVWREQGAPIWVALVLALAGLLPAIAHVRPFGSRACLMLMIGAAWIVRHAAANRGQARVLPDASSCAVLVRGQACTFVRRC